ncbi:TPA: hypothetical protein DCX15_06215 [bacterium]|nr:hypothetical protein [bacterium]
MEIKVFGTKLCPSCNIAVRRVNEAIEKWNGEIRVNYYDMETVDGLTEGALNEVMKIPTIILSERGRLVARWNGEVPEAGEFQEKIGNPSI